MSTRYRARTGIAWRDLPESFGPYRVELFLRSIKRFRAVARRRDKTARNDLAMVQVACACQRLT